MSADSADHPPAFFVTVAAIGLSVAALFAAVGFVVASSQFRRYGGFLVVAVLAVAVRALDADR